MPPKVATRSTLETVAVLDELLSQQTGATVGEMCERLDCHVKTVRRHLNWMRAKLDIRIVYLGGQGQERRYIYPTGQDSIFTADARRRLR
jgi:predicted ArsR family transcriptional regulator